MKIVLLCLTLVAAVITPVSLSAGTEGELGDAITRGDLDTLNGVLASRPDDLDSEALQRLLGYAASIGNITAIEILLAAGVDINAPLDGGWTAVGIALLSDQQEVALAMLGLGADPAFANEESQTPLSVADALGHTAFAERAAQQTHATAMGAAHTPTKAPDHQPPGRLIGKKWIQVYSRPTRAEAVTIARGLLLHWPHTQIFQSRNGQFAVVVGTAIDPDELHLLEEFKTREDEEKRIPIDSYFVSGASYVEDVLFDRTPLPIIATADPVREPSGLRPKLRPDRTPTNSSIVSLEAQTSKCLRIKGYRAEIAQDDGWCLLVHTRFPVAIYSNCIEGYCLQFYLRATYEDVYDPNFRDFGFRLSRDRYAARFFVYRTAFVTSSVAAERVTDNPVSIDTNCKPRELSSANGAIYYREENAKSGFLSPYESMSKGSNYWGTQSFFRHVRSCNSNIPEFRVSFDRESSGRSRIVYARLTDSELNDMFSIVSKRRKALDERFREFYLARMRSCARGQSHQCGKKAVIDHYGSYWYGQIDGGIAFR